MILYKVSVLDLGGELCVSPIPSRQSQSQLEVPWDMQHITDISGWMTRQVKVITPCDRSGSGVEVAQSFPGMALVLEDDNFSVLEACAGAAFARWTVAELQWLIRTQ
eukprot:8651881-Heterocapsa_arctica.AAC.1